MVSKRRMGINNKKKNFSASEQKLYSFILDPFLLVGIGILIAYLASVLSKKFPGAKKFIVPLLGGVALCIFLFISGSLYFDRFNMPMIGEYGWGNHFMWNSGVELVGLEPLIDTAPPTYADPKSPMNILAVGIFLTYPFFLCWGIRMGRKWVDGDSP